MAVVVRILLEQSLYTLADSNIHIREKTLSFHLPTTIMSRYHVTGSRVDSVLDSGAEGPGFKLQL